MKKAEERVNRKSFRIKLFIWIGMMALFFSCFCGCYGKNTRTTADMAKMGEEIGVKVTFFDVGKGDAILIETAGHRMLIDAGYDDTVGVILDYLREKGVKKLDYMVITHFDKDQWAAQIGFWKRWKWGKSFSRIMNRTVNNIWNM